MSLTRDSYRWLRLFFGAVAVLQLLTAFPFRDLFYGSEALCPAQSFLLPTAGVVALWVTGLAAAACVIWGRFYRVASVVLYLVLIFFFRTPCRPDNFGDHIFAGLAFLMMFACLPSRPFSLRSLKARDVPNFGFPDSGRAVASDVQREAGDLPSGSGWLHQTLRLYAGTLYLVPVLYRLGGEQWWNGTAVWTALADPTTSRIWESLSRDPWGIPTWLIYGATWGAMAFEGLFPFLIWVRRLRVPLVVTGVIFHAVMALVLDLGLFPLQMAAVLVGCLEFSPIAPSLESPSDRG